MHLVAIFYKPVLCKFSTILTFYKKNQVIYLKRFHYFPGNDIGINLLFISSKILAFA